jgi:hypothetical protein
VTETKISDLLAYCDAVKPNAFDTATKLVWVNEIEGMIQTDVMLIASADVVQYDAEDTAAALLVPAPHDKLYRSYLCAMIDFANGEYDRYNNSMAMFNTHYREFTEWYIRIYRPADEAAEFKGYYISAYGLAVKHGFQGNEEAWLASLKGNDGAQGRGLSVLGIYPTLTELQEAVTDPEAGDGYAVGTADDNEIYVWDGTGWANIGTLRGPQGETGPQGLQGGPGPKGDTGEAGPQGIQGPPGETGPKGDPGDAATVTVGTVTTGAAGTQAAVTNTGTQHAAVLNFTIPRGDKGEKGDKGDQGERGLQGEQGIPGEPGQKGDPGKDFAILGYYASLSALQAAVTTPEAGDAYGVGSVAPYDVYVWDGINLVWVNNGAIQGPKGDTGAPGEKGDPGESGATFIPSVSAGGEISWTNDKGLTNPTTRNIKGPKGDKGDTGDPGPNTVSTTTNTNITGLLKGTGSKVAQAVAGTDYAAANHTHSAYLDKSGGTLTGAVTAHNGTDYGTARVRNISAGTADLTAGSSALASGDIYFVYE